MRVQPRGTGGVCRGAWASHGHGRRGRAAFPLEVRRVVRVPDVDDRRVASVDLLGLRGVRVLPDELHHAGGGGGGALAREEVRRLAHARDPRERMPRDDDRPRSVIRRVPLLEDPWVHVLPVLADLQLPDLVQQRPQEVGARVHDPSDPHVRSVPRLFLPPARDRRPPRVQERSLAPGRPGRRQASRRLRTTNCVSHRRRLDRHSSSRCRPASSRTRSHGLPERLRNRFRLRHLPADGTQRDHEGAHDSAPPHRTACRSGPARLVSLETLFEAAEATIVNIIVESFPVKHMRNIRPYLCFIFH